VGKTRTINTGRRLALTLPEFHIAPLSVTFAALVDALTAAKRYIIVNPPDDPIQFNSIFICAHELGAFMHKYDNEMIDGLAAFYDCVPYDQSRRHQEDKPRIDSPQVNCLAGSTPQNLASFMPEKAWGQGFSSRIIMVFSDERIIGDDFAIRGVDKLDNLVYDLKAINSMYGQFHVTQEYVDCINNWRQLGEPPVPNHPKLIHYVTRRRVHLYKLSMVSSVDRGNTLTITREDFNRAISWLVEAELQMPEVFKAGATNVDGQAMDEIQHFVMVGDRGQGVSEQRIVHFARERVPIHSILRIIEIMERSGMIRCARVEKRTGVRFFSLVKETLQ